MGTTKTLKWGISGLLAVSLVFIGLWVGLVRQYPERPEIGEPGSVDLEPTLGKRNIEAMNVSQLKAYIKACERTRNFYACERAYQRAIQLTQGEKSLFKEFIDFKFGLAELCLNSLWEYGQFGGDEEIPPALSRAIGIYDQIIASYPGSNLAADAQFRKGEVFNNEFSGYWNNLHREDAIREFQAVIRLYPGTYHARRAAERLAALEREEPGPSADSPSEEREDHGR